MDWPKLYITIVNYNAARFLPDCLLTLRTAMAAYFAQHQQPVFSLIVDNASTDASYSAAAPFLTLAAGRPDEMRDSLKVEWRAAGANTGYGGGANIGWARLRRKYGTNAVYIVLNPDMSFQPDFLTELVRPLVEMPEVGVVGAKLVFPPDAQGVVRVQHAGGFFDPATLAAQHYGYDQPDGTERTGKIDYLTGAALALRGATYEKLLTDGGNAPDFLPPDEPTQRMLAAVRAEEATGPFDPHFFPGYFEDVDLCWRAHAAGFALHYAPMAVATHFEGGSFNRGQTYYRLSGLNRLRLFAKHWPTARLLSEFLPKEAARLHLPRDPQERRATSTLYREMAGQTRSV